MIDNIEGNAKPHYVYIFKKQDNANKNLKNYDLVYKTLEQEELEYEDEDGEEQKEINTIFEYNITKRLYI